MQSHPQHNDDEPLLAGITRHSPLALYYQLKRRILDGIDSGRLEPGCRLPAEREAARQSGLSRMTVRQAYAELMAEGALVRQPGRGTFVAGRKARYGIAMPGGFTEESTRRGLPPTTRVVGVDAIAAPPEAAEALELAPGETVYRIRRRHAIGRCAVDYAVCYVSQRQFPGLDRRDLTSLYRTFADRYNTVIVRAEESVEPRRASQEAARMLDVPRGALILFMRRTSYSERNEPVEYVELFLNSRQYRFVMEVGRDRHCATETMAPLETAH